ncbi:MAG: lysophospholipid acyltransferase family protein [Deltaproteobacteria bacterium]|jgi:KDO2-lipid IV(A) lauroyltransferase|nr:lysophospholipid acyltransferase family protein [Deltaproteobacteria bacterium]
MKPDSSFRSLSLLHKIQFVCMLAALRLLRRLGFKGLYHLGGGLGFLLWHFSRKRRAYATDSVQRHLEVSREEAIRIARASFGHSFRSFLELVLAGGFTTLDNTRLEAVPDSFRNIQEEEKAVVAISAHLGAWELLAGIMGGLRTAHRRILVVRNQKNPAANALIRGLRENTGVEVAGHRNASAAVLEVLRDRGTTAFLVDHNAIRNEAVFLPFLGENAAVNFGPAMLALRSKAVLYAAFLIRKPGPRYELIATSPLDSGTLEGSIGEKTRRIAEFYTRTVEDFIRLYPEQWFWMHQRWKTRALKEDGPSAPPGG